LNIVSDYCTYDSQFKNILIPKTVRRIGVYTLRTKIADTDNRALMASVGRSKMRIEATAK
jgi:hypothetical protein